MHNAQRRHASQRAFEAVEKTLRAFPTKFGSLLRA